MATYDNAPPPDDWRPPCKCGTCHTCFPPVTIPPNVTVGEN